ncbi:hypothetical protein J3R08_004194 [Micromonospora sp. HB375]|nr:hypothetical protein [Micromonospora sp. HB375]MDH6470936.1 hypothetical protein [Micromonospora sp. H404/HB375]
MRRGRRAAGKWVGGGVARERRSGRRERRGVGWIARKAVRVACHACPVGLFCRRQRGFSVGTGEGNPRPHRWCTHARSGIGVRRARRAGAGPREWLWFHLPPFGGWRPVAASGLVRRRPLGRRAGHGRTRRSSTCITVDGSAPIGDAATVTPVTGLEKPLNEIETWKRVSALAVVVGALPCHTLVTPRGASDASAGRRGHPVTTGAAPRSPARPGRPPFRTPPSPRVRPVDAWRRPAGAPEVPARSEETPPT